MTWFSFIGKDSLGNRVSGRHKADSELMLISRLQAAGMTQVSVKKIGALHSGWYAIKAVASRCIRVRKIDLSIFYYQLADMLEMGIPLKQALLVIASHLNHPKLVSIIYQLVSSLSKGLSFAEALHQHKRIFSSVTLQLVALAHTKEELTAILRYCDQSMRRITFFSKLLFVIMPQISINIVLSMILLFLRFHYLPSFYYAISIFRNPVPTIIQVFDVVTGLLTVNLLWTVAIIIIGVILCRMILFFCAWVRFFLNVFLYYLPIVGGLIVAFERERLSLLYSILLKDGVSVQQCVRYSLTVTHNLLFRRHAQKLCGAIQRGEVFADALRIFKIFSIAEIQMIALGAAANSLPKTFARIYSISQMILERKLFFFSELLRFSAYLFNAGLFFFNILVAETLFFYPGLH